MISYEKLFTVMGSRRTRIYLQVSQTYASYVLSPAIPSLSQRMVAQEKGTLFIHAFLGTLKANNHIKRYPGK